MIEWLNAIAAVVVPALIGFAAGVLCTASWWRRECVRRGHAEWYTDHTGMPAWKWREAQRP